MSIALIETTRERPPALDAELAHAAGRGDTAAFEALYERHHGALLSFSRHMLGRVHDAEDVVQHTFLAADAAFRAGEVPQSVRAWLYAVARNRCVSILRARRDDHALPDPGVPSAENLAEEVEQRDDLRALLADLRTLPDDQRAALLLAELGDLSHAEVAQVLGVRARKVKALVYQARQALLAAAGARAIPCRSIREELAVATGSARRRRHLRDHVARCDGCRAYADGVARQRASLAAILPVVPTVALRDTVLVCLGEGGTATATAGLGACGGGAGVGVCGGAGSSASTAGITVGSAATAAGGAGGAIGAKLLAVAAIGGAAGGGAVAVTAPDPPDRRPQAAQVAPARVVAAAPRHGLRVAAPVPSSARPEAAGKTAPRALRPENERAERPGHARQEARGERSRKPKPEHDAARGSTVRPKKAAVGRSQATPKKATGQPKEPRKRSKAAPDNATGASTLPREGSARGGLSETPPETSARGPSDAPPRSSARDEAAPAKPVRASPPPEAEPPLKQK